MALYPYTLQPIDLNLTEAEFREAQRQLFDSNNHSLAKISTKVWLIVGAVVVLAVIGLIFVHGYSTIIFWLMLIGVVIFLLARTYGLKWYVKQEFEKQMANQQMPSEMQQLKLGVQQHGIVMSMPAPAMSNAQKRGFNQPLMRGGATQQAIIKWNSVTNWQETPDFIMMMFAVPNQQGEVQQGTQIVPKRLANQKFPIDTLRHHLQETVGVQGFDLKDKPTDKYFPENS